MQTSFFGFCSETKFNFQNFEIVDRMEFEERGGGKIKKKLSIFHYE